MFKYVMFTFVMVIGMACPADDAPVGDNMATGKPYTLRPAPNYRHCTDPGDRTQLTDGQYTEGYFWTQRGTVGWSRANPAVVTIDLGQVQPIRGISYSTAAGVAGVQWPLSIQVLTSDDGEQHRMVGDLVELDARQHGGPPPIGEFARYRFRADQLATRGRYVTLVIALAGSFTFVDEIEVHRGEASLLTRPPGGRVVTSIGAAHRQAQIDNGVRRRLRHDLAAVREQLKQADLVDQHAAELTAVERAIDAVRVDDPANFRAVLPLNELHRRIFKLQAAAWRAEGVGSLHVWQTGRWDPLSPTGRPGPGGASIDVAMMRNAHRGAAFNLANAGTEPVTVDLSIDDLPGSVTVHDVPFTDTKAGIPVAAALPVAPRGDDDAWRIEVPAGMTRQVWLTFDSDQVDAGEYRGRINLTPGDRHVPVRWRVYPFDMPAESSLNLGGWDYTDTLARDVTEANREALVAHLRQRFVNTPWAMNATLSRGEHDRTGRMTAPPDTTRCDRWLDRWPDAKTYCVFMSFGDRFASFQRNTPAWKRALGDWIGFWVEHFAERGIDANRLALLLVDEPHEHEQDRRIIDYARVIRDAAPGVVIWEDPTWRQPDRALPGLFEVCDVLCPNTVHLIGQGEPFVKFYQRQREAGRALWLYSCSGPGRLMDPYAYHRMQQWFCFRYDAPGSGFWAFGDSNGASSWNEYLAGRGAYTPLFLDAETVTPGKHMEAIREGVEDYETLLMLRRRVEALAEAGVTTPVLAEARKLLADAPVRVTAVMTSPKLIHWHQDKDRTRADRTRIQILETLTRLPQSP